jgi:hypothetical protein
MSQPPPSQNHLSAADIVSLVRNHLPAWMQACEATDTDAIALHAAEFGESATELLLFACAIKVAAGKGKNVYVTCDRGNGQTEIVTTDRFIAVYREADGKRHDPSPQKSKRRAPTRKPR